jgi:hypothetical protein
MKASTPSSAPRGLLPYLLAALISVPGAIPGARADDVPPLRQGLWEYQRTTGAQKFAATECIDPGEDLRRQHAALERMGCKLAPAVQTGATYTYVADCSLKLPSGVVNFSTTTVLSADGDSAYRIESRMVNQGVTTNETIAAHRVADCTE